MRWRGAPSRRASVRSTPERRCGGRRLRRNPRRASVSRSGHLRPAGASGTNRPPRSGACWISWRAASVAPARSRAMALYATRSVGAARPSIRASALPVRRPGLVRRNGTTASPTSATTKGVARKTVRTGPALFPRIPFPATAMSRSAAVPKTRTTCRDAIRGLVAGAGGDRRPVLRRISHQAPGNRLD